jgi:branched-chain amino acid transport system substrate-binding protein
MPPRLFAPLAAAALLATTAVARADITLGAIISITGPTAAQGAGYKNAFAVMPETIAGQKVTYIIRDDGGDPNAAVNIAQKMLSDDHIDAMIGPSLTASAFAAQPLLTAAHVPMVVTSPIPVDPVKNFYTFATVQPVGLMVTADVDHMKAHGVKTVGYIGYSDGFGDQVYAALTAAAAKAGIEVVANERYARSDTSVEAQVLRVLVKHPDAVMLGGSATPGALPAIALHKRGFKGQVYQNHGVVSPDYIRVGAGDVEGNIAPTGPVVVFDQLPDDNVVKPVATAFMQAYLAKFGPQSRSGFAGYSYDAYLLLANAIPVALAHAQPGTPAFHEALRDALAATHELVGTEGVYTMSPTDHIGLDTRARVLVVVKGGSWTLLK